MNGDGKLDLVVANSGSNNVLVFLAAPDANSGTNAFLPPQSFFTGTAPTSPSIQDLNGDQIDDLIVANQGSNDVSVLLGQGNGSNWTMTSGPRLKAGQGPAATLITDKTGPAGVPDGIPDLVVTNSQSDNAYLIPGVGGGFFNDFSPIIFPTGSSPGPIVEGNFGLGFINTGSNNISVYPGTDPSQFLLVDTHGSLPIGAVTFDENFDGFDDLLVVHNGDGEVSFLLGGIGGLEWDFSFTVTGFDHFSSLAEFGSGLGLEVFGASEGSEAATLLFSFKTATPDDPSDFGFANELVFGLTSMMTRSSLSLNFVSLRGSTLPIVATLLSVFELADADEEETQETGRATGTKASGEGSSDEAGDESDDPESRAELAPLQKLLLDFEEALKLRA